MREEQPKVSLDAFCAVLSNYLGEPVKPESKIVCDLSTFGDDFDVLLVFLRKNVGLELKPDVDLAGRMPGEPHLLNLIGNLFNLIRGRNTGPYFLSPPASYSVRDLYDQLRPAKEAP